MLAGRFVWTPIPKTSIIRTFPEPRPFWLRSFRLVFHGEPIDAIGRKGRRRRTFAEALSDWLDRLSAASQSWFPVDTPLLQRRSPLGPSYALLILWAFFLLLPAAFLAARLSLKSKENDVRDWLPSDFRETAELAWFAKHFAGESFVVATWDGCHSGDQRLRLLYEKVRRESADADRTIGVDAAMSEKIVRAQKLGRELGLVLTGESHTDWAGLNEKWLRDAEGGWYYILPDGKLYRWTEAQTGPAALLRAIRKRGGDYRPKGQAITAFGSASADGRPSPFYEDPTLFTVPLFERVQTGETVLAELAAEGGPLYSGDLTDATRRPIVARRRGLQRLSGTLFAPAVPDHFAWTAEAFADPIREGLRQRSVATVGPPADGRGGQGEIPAAGRIDEVLDAIVAERFDGDRSRLADAPARVQEAVWYETFDRLGVPPPPRLTCLLITLSDAARENLAFALGRGVMDMPRGRLLELAEASGVTPAPAPSMAPPPFNQSPKISVAGAPPLRMGGPPVDNIAIDEEGTVTLMRLVGYSIAVGILLSLVCFRSIKITIMVFVVGGSAALLSMAMVYWTGGRVDAILMSMPSLVYVLGLSGAIHVVNYYRDEVAHHGPVGAPARALRHAVLPCTLAALTTAIGLASLTTSNLVPISNFGFYSAVGVIATLAVLFSYLPAALQTFMSPKKRPEGSDPKPDVKRDEHSGLAQWWADVGTFITGRHAIVSTLCLLVLAIASIGLTNIQTSVQLLKLFDSDSRIIEDYAWLEENLGDLVPMEVVLRMPEDMSTIEQLEATTRIRRLITQTLGEPGMGVVGSSTSLDNFLPDVPEGGSRYSVFRAQFERQLEQASADVYGSDYVTEEADGPYAGRALWRISLRVAALSDVDYGLFLRTLESAVDPALRAYEIKAQILAGGRSSNTGDGEQSTAGTRVLVLGSGPPPSIEETDLIAADGSIRRDQAMLAVMGELLKAASLEKLTWRTVDADLASKLRGDERFEKLLAGYDVVLWNDQGFFRESDLSAARRLYKLRDAATRQPEPLLLAGGVPDVHRGGPMTAIYTGVVPVI